MLTVVRSSVRLLGVYAFARRKIHDHESLNLVTRQLYRGFLSEANSSSGGNLIGESGDGEVMQWYLIEISCISQGSRLLVLED